MRPLGIVHRDVSPQNVLLSFEGEVKVTDFGIAKARGALDQSAPRTRARRKLQGKFGYMSPEQARGESVDARSDLFSLGTMLYECVAGVNPFSAPTTFETLRRVQACEYPPIELLRPDVPAGARRDPQDGDGRASPPTATPDAGRMYEALLAFLYAQGSRYGAHDLAEFLARFRESSETAPRPSPRRCSRPRRATRRSSARPSRCPSSRQARRASASRQGSRFAAIDRAAEMGERREVTALVIELPRDTPAAVVDKAASIVERWGGRVLRREAGHIAALFGLGDPDGRDTEMATRCALVALRSLDAVAPARRRPPHRAHPRLERRRADRGRAPRHAARHGARPRPRARRAAPRSAPQAMRQVKALFEFEPMTEGDRAAASVSGVLVKDVRGPGEAFGRFVGRKDELRRIGEVLAAATKRTARVLTIRGDHGVGKTRLLYEVERRLRKGGYNVGFHIAACPPRGNEFPLSGIVVHAPGALRHGRGRRAGAHPGGAAAPARARPPGRRGERRAHRARRARPLVHRATRRRSCARPSRAWCRASARTARTPSRGTSRTRWTRRASRSWRRSMRRLRQSRVVFVFAARAGFSHPLEKRDGHVALDLGDLAPADVERLVALAPRRRHRAR